MCSQNQIPVLKSISCENPVTEDCQNRKVTNRSLRDQNMAKAKFTFQCKPLPQNINKIKKNILNC